MSSFGGIVCNRLKLQTPSHHDPWSFFNGSATLSRAAVTGLAARHYLLHCMSPKLGPKRQFLRRDHTSGVGGEADMPRQLDRRGPKAT
jgi:hypothetical protein